MKKISCAILVLVQPKGLIKNKKFRALRIYLSAEERNQR